jgi:hypothetical protein
VVEGARLESEYTAKPYRGFESLPLRQPSLKLRLASYHRVRRRLSAEALAEVGSAESEGEGLSAGVEKLDREGAVADGAFLPD